MPAELLQKYFRRKINYFFELFHGPCMHGGDHTAQGGQVKAKLASTSRQDKRQGTTSYPLYLFLIIN